MSCLTMIEARRITKPDEEEAYLQFVRIWQSFDPEIVPVASRRFRIKRPVDEKFERGPDRYPAGGGYRILRRPQMFEDE